MKYDDLFAPTPQEIEAKRKKDIASITIETPSPDVVSELQKIRNMNFPDRSLPKIYIEGEYEKDDRPVLEKLNSKMKAAIAAEENSPLRYNMVRGMVAQAQKFGLDIEMPRTIGDAELILESIERD